MHTGGMVGGSAPGFRMWDRSVVARVWRSTTALRQSSGQSGWACGPAGYGTAEAVSSLRRARRGLWRLGWGALGSAGQTPFFAKGVMNGAPGGVCHALRVRASMSPPVIRVVDGCPIQALLGWEDRHCGLGRPIRLVNYTVRPYGRSISQRSTRLNLKLLFRPARLASVLHQRFTLYRRLNRAIRDGRNRLNTSPAYRPDLVPAGFAPRPDADGNNTALLMRICDAYEKSKQDQARAAEAFNVSNEWLPIYDRLLGPVMRALRSRDLNALQQMYGNFYRDACSSGLAGMPVNMQRAYYGSSIKDWHRHLYLCDVVHRHELWKQETGNQYPISELKSPDIGNPYGFFVDDIFLKAGCDYQHYYAMQIRELLPPSGDRVVMELGGGFGGMAYYLIRDAPGVTYVDFDLPENIALASYYLLKAFPNLRATLYGEAELSPEVLQGSRIVLMPSFEILKMQDRSASISFNSYSLAEMSPSSIKEYIGNIAQVTSGHFMHVNHTVNAVMTADHFGVEEYGFQLLERRMAGWTLGLNPNADEFQFLYKAPEMMGGPPVR